MLGVWAACTSLTRDKEGGSAVIDEDFYEDDEPIETIQAIRARPYDLVTGPPAPRAVTVNLFLTTDGSWKDLSPSLLSEAVCR